jgi:transketolase
MEDVEVWVVSKFPFGKIPTELMQTINTTKKLLTIEEHLAAGGLGEMIAVECINQLTSTIQFKSLHIQGYLSGKYGSQQWHLEENSLAGTNLQNQLQAFLK